MSYNSSFREADFKKKMHTMQKKTELRKTRPLSSTETTTERGLSPSSSPNWLLLKKEKAYQHQQMQVCKFPPWLLSTRATFLQDNHCCVHTAQGTLGFLSPNAGSGSSSADPLPPPDLPQERRKGSKPTQKAASAATHRQRHTYTHTHTQKKLKFTWKDEQGLAA